VAVHRRQRGWQRSGGSGCVRVVPSCPCTHPPFLFHQNRSPLTSYPSIVIKLPFSVSPRSYADVVSLSAGSPHARPQITPSSNLDNTTKYRHQPQRIARDCSMAEKMAEAPHSHPFPPLYSNLDNSTKYCHQPQRIASCQGSLYG